MTKTCSIDNFHAMSEKFITAVVPSVNMSVFKMAIVITCFLMESNAATSVLLP